MNWTSIWMYLFGKTEFLGLNIGFWVAMLTVVLIVIIMNIIVWSMKPHEIEKDNNKIN